MNPPADLDALSPDELRTLAAQLMAQVGEKDRELRYRQTRIDQLTHVTDDVSVVLVAHRHAFPAVV
ncbi:hypothetical protein [Burkholderia ubonensis]|uniref:Uncharacterized protein n=1 Tax=Burkholderia ubonensis TaxID=101571 RepID=A0A106IXH6_9BURK|nr:hypothetical protein [Burkholderia ubonensis]KVZ41017.1 hypothetical protein WL16_28330 [Burkholderia ubonensis]KWA69448.1 hypothetical protein WL29_09305 [Burkholderia ubonensis]KWB97300.1 hypothetical protein WL43_30135 [Burkholderia ubonensis]KWZ58321.1 hypothetical protein WK57_17500 [Burkholderia ubonensis]